MTAPMDVAAEVPLSRAAIAEQAGVSSTTLRNWALRTDHPLETTITASGARLYTWSALLRFCDRHPELQGTAAVRAARVASVPAYRSTADPNDEKMRAALQEMRAAVDASFEALSRSAELATAIAGAHADTIAALRKAMKAQEACLSTLATGS